MKLRILCILAMGGSGFAEPVDDRTKLEEIFRTHAVMPGGEYAAAVAARGDAAGFLAIIQADAKLLESPRGRLIEAELLLASGRKNEARGRFKALTDVAGKGDWGTGQPGYYPVELPGSSSEFLFTEPLAPYTYASGSHRDNWLLRRLIALDLMDEAAREFARIWEIHRANSKPYAMLSRNQDESLPPDSELKDFFYPTGFNGLGLQFALDYAYFLKRTKRADEGLNVLMEPLRVIDMDHNPNFISSKLQATENPEKHPIRSAPVVPESYGSYSRVVVARKEFIRLAYGEFKNAKREGALVELLQKQIDQGDNRARRVLAQIKLHEGDTGAAFALELEYIEKGGFNPVSAAYRKGLIYEANGKTDEAVIAFEQALAAESLMLDSPADDEQTTESRRLMLGGIPGIGGFRASELNRREVEERLERLYAAQGRMDKVIELQFAQFDADENQLEQLQYVEEMAARMKSAGQEERFTKWVAGKLATSKSLRTKANLAWLLGDYLAAVRHAAEIYQGNYYEMIWWREQFLKIDPKHELGYLQAIVKRIPGDVFVRLELLDLQDNVDGLEAVAALEALLETDAETAFPRGNGPWKIEGYFDLTYRLMRLYEKHNLLDKLRATGLRMAREQKPFDKFDSHAYESSGSNGREEYGNACLALAVQHADAPAYQTELATALETSRWVGARSQMARRLGKVVEPKTGGASPLWANLPPDTQVIVSCNSVTCVAKSERFLYAGMPWGVAVYNNKGMPVTRILLGNTVTHLVAVEDQLWVGTQAGLFLITAGKWTIAHQPVGEVVALGLDGEQLWIGVREHTDKSLMTLNRRTLAMRTFSAEEIGIERTIDFTRFEADGKYVWADNYFGLLRYERATDRWSAVENPGPRDPVHLIGIVDGQVWADVWINDELRHRPARLNRKTLELTPLKMRGNSDDRYDGMINSDLVFIGHHHGQPVFSVKDRSDERFVVEKNSNNIRRLQEAEDENKAEMISDPLPDLAAAIPVGAWPDGLRKGVRSTRWTDRWPDDAVWAVVFDDARKQDWLCVGTGLAVMPRDGSPLRHFSNTEGLTLGPMLDGVELNGKFYFASAWDDRGSLTVYDTETRVFTPWFRSDGMDSNKVLGLAVKEGKLEVRYGVEKSADVTKNDLSPGQFDPATGRFTSGGKESIAPVEGKLAAPAINDILPVLGGAAYRSYQRDGKTWHCGARGLVIFSGTKAPALTFAPMPVRRIPSAIEISREQAKKIKIPDPITAKQLKELVKHPNPNVRFRAVQASYSAVTSDQAAEFAPILLDRVNDKFPYVRAIAVWNLSQCESPAAIAPLREALDDTDPCIRAMATVAMAKLGEVPPLEHFKNAIKYSDKNRSFPCGDDSSFSVGASDHEVFTSLARHADRKIFEFLVTLPPPNLHYIQPVYPAFGESLRKHPDAASVLLAVQDKERHGPWQTFVPAVFQHAGKEILPILHEALTSKERVVRSNAARACGAIGDKSSIPHLLQALDLESGLSRASIVWALGELKASEAVSRLIALHKNERNAENNRNQGAGLLVQNTATINQGAYTNLSNLNTIESDWDELQTSTQSRPHDPVRDEVLLTPEHILEAVQKIGGSGAQAFYRVLAAATSMEDRMAAVVGLAEVEAARREENMVILRRLLADPERKVRTSAWVSLHALGEPGFAKVLRKSDPEERDELITQMNRLPVPLLEPLRADLEFIFTDQEKAGTSSYLTRLLLERIDAPR